MVEPRRDPSSATGPARSHLVSSEDAHQVVLVHGLWMQAWSMALIARRLRHAGFAPYLFPYYTVRHSLQQSAAALARYVQTLPPTRHPRAFVGYSLGGLVLRALCAQIPFPADTRVVTLGTPHRGSRAADALARWPGGTRLLGQAIGELRAALPQQWPHCPGTWGSIAGSRSIGLGHLVTRFDGPNDGTVAIDETMLDGVTDRIVLPVSHFSMLFAPIVVRQTAHFLRTGGFRHDR